MTEWFDTHAHLQDEAFEEDFDAVLARARDKGVTRILLASSNEEDSKTICRFVLEHPMLYAAVGVHPHDAKSCDEKTSERLKELILDTNKRAQKQGRDKAVVAIGEIGLDYHYDFSPRDVQQKNFRKQLELAYELSLPVVIHMREATEATLNMLNAANDDGLFSKEAPAGVIHCYSGSAETVPLLTDLGFMIGFDGPLTFKNAKKPIAALQAVPCDRLVLETDAPYLTPVPFRGKRNESSYLPLIGEKVAEIMGKGVNDVAEQTTANALRLFRI